MAALNYRLAELLTPAQSDYLWRLTASQGGAAWVPLDRSHGPDREIANIADSVNEELRRVLAEVLSGTPVQIDPAATDERMAREIEQTWTDTHDPRLLDAAIEARRAVVRLTPAGHDLRRPRLFQLARLLDQRLEPGGGAPDGELDELLQIWTEAAPGDETTDQDFDPASYWFRYGMLLDMRRARDAGGHAEDIAESLAAWERAVALLPDDHPGRSTWLTGLAEALIAHIEADPGAHDNIDRLIGILSEIAQRDDLSPQSDAWGLYASWLERRREQDSDRHSDDLDAAIVAWGHAVDKSTAETPGRAVWLKGLATALGTRIHVNEHDGDLDRSIEALRELVTREDLAGCFSDPVDAFVVYGDSLLLRWSRNPDLQPEDADFAAAAQARHQVVVGTPTGHPDRLERVYRLAEVLSVRITTDSEQEGDLDLLIGAVREITEADSEILVGKQFLGHPWGDGEAWAYYAQLLELRYGRSPEEHPEDIDAAAEAWARVISLVAADNPQYTRSLMRLVNVLIARVNAGLERRHDLDRIVAINAEITGRDDASGTVADPAQPWQLYADSLDERRQRDPERNASDLDASIKAWKRAVEATPPESAMRTFRLMKLAAALRDRLHTEVEQGDDRDLFIAIAAEITGRDDFEEHAPNDPAGWWQAYGEEVDHRRAEPGDEHPGDLDAATKAWHQAVLQTPADQPLRALRLMSLGQALSERIEAGKGNDGDVELMIIVAGEAAGYSGQYGVDPALAWANYGTALDRSRTLPGEHSRAYLHMAVEAWEKAVAHLPEGDHMRANWLVQLMNASSAEFNATGHLGDLDRLIEICRELTYSDRPDSANVWAQYGTLSRLRWERDPTAHSVDLGEFVTAMDTCLSLSTDSDPREPAWYAQSANAHLLGHLNGVPAADLGTAIQRARTVLTTGSAEDQARLLDALRRLASQEQR